MLYRLSYTKAGASVAVTFWSADFIDALYFQLLWNQLTKTPDSELVPIGISRVLPGGRTRSLQDNAVLAVEDLSKEEMFQLEISQHE